jgi:3'(2'), 5'-bisphosphate nucleotidase
VISEEAADIPWATRQAWTRLWLVDPLDGTREFIKKNGEFTVNIALIEDGVPVLGVVYAPALDYLVHAERRCRCLPARWRGATSRWQARARPPCHCGWRPVARTWMRAPRPCWNASARMSDWASDPR